ncbi:MAG: tetratricopeptide repeat protein [Gallionellaceae bacterium]
MNIFAIVISVVFVLYSNVVQADAWSDAVSAYQKENYSGAATLARPLAEQGNVLAQVMLGVMYEEGQGVSQDDQEAVKWYSMAAAQGRTDYQRIIGSRYELGGRGVTQNRQEAIKYYRLGAAQGEVWFQMKLGSMYESDRNAQEAMKWYRMAADQGDAFAQMELGKLYRGHQDFNKAHLWCSLAVQNGNNRAIQCRDDTAKNMTPEKISQVQQLVSDCQKINFKNCETTMSVVETITCEQYFVDLRREKVRGILFGKPLQSYKRDDLVAMQGQVQNCSATTVDEVTNQKIAAIRLTALIEEYDTNVRQAAENERLKIEEAKRLALESDLKSGRKQPENFSELKIATGAVDGMALASAPKIKPDNKLYAMVGVIDSAGHKPEFMASNGVEGLRMLGYRNTEHTYFRVKIPKSMQSRYYDTAKIGVWFRLIGRYVANGSYSTVAGQKKSMPVFEATYWEPADVIGDAIKAQLQEVFERAK